MLRRAFLVVSLLVAHAVAFAPVPAQLRVRAISRCPPMRYDFYDGGMSDLEPMSGYQPEKPKKRSKHYAFRDAVLRERRRMTAKTGDSGLSEAAQQLLEARRLERERAVLRAKSDANDGRRARGSLLGLLGRRNRWLHFHR